MQKRIAYLDWLRIFSIFSVVVLHVSAQNWYTTDVNGFAWQTFNFYDSIVRWSVPVFVMISGCLFLNRDIPLERIYHKYICRLAIAFFAWSIFYACFDSHNILTFVVNVLRGKYHMWFIPMIIGLYMVLPIIKLIIQKQDIMKYFLCLSFIFVFLLPWISKIIHDFGGRDAIMITDALNKSVQSMKLQIVFGFTGYFILGYYLNSIEITRKNRIVIYILGFIGFALTVFLQSALALKIQNRHSNYYDVFSVNVLLSCIALFVWFKYTEFFKQPSQMIEKLSCYSFGVYLVHVFVLEQLKIRFGLNTLLFNPVISVPVISISVYVISVIISAILHRIPIAKKYFV